MNDIVATLVDRFRLVDLNNMRDLPIYNNALKVEATDFQEIVIENEQNAWIGALLTPWFMKVILLSEIFNAAAELGQHVKHSLPSGEHEFMVGEDEVIGRYDFLTLASPVLKYKTQSSAMVDARIGLKKLLTAVGENGAIPLPQTVRIVRRTESGVEGTIDRRRFLRGHFRQG